MKIKILFLIFGMILLIGLVSAECKDYTLGCKKIGTCFNITQLCSNCSYVNVLSIEYPKGTDEINTLMTQNGSRYYYQYCPSHLGQNIINTDQDVEGIPTPVSWDFFVNLSGEESSTGQSILYFIFVIVMFGILILLFYFIFTMPKDNEKESDGMIKIVKMKYLRIFLIALTYPIFMIILNLMNGLAVNFTSLSIFSGTLGFLFEIMLRASWVWTVIIFLRIIYNLIKDSNVKKRMDKLERFKIT